MSKISRNYLQPDEFGPVYQQVGKFLQCKRAGRTMGRYLLECDVLRRKAEARAVIGSAFLYGLVSILRMHIAALSGPVFRGL